MRIVFSYVRFGTSLLHIFFCCVRFRASLLHIHLRRTGGFCGEISISFL